MTLYMDDSGTRHPDHPGSPTPQGHDWFGLGGVLVRQDDEQQCRTLHEELCQKWRITYPLHSVRIRNRSQKFAWIGALDPQRQKEFYEDLTKLIISLPAVGIACVIDRPGYNNRYREKYAGHRWHLCKTGFAVVVERAAKHAMRMGCKLNVAIEESDKNTDRAIREYYSGMRASGLPFDPNTSSKYAPLDAATLSGILYDFKIKKKESPMIQFADLYLYPMCRGGYEKTYRPYTLLHEHGRTIDSVLPAAERDVHGIKYSCFEAVHQRNSLKKD